MYINIFIYFPCYAETLSEIYEESQREFFTENIMVLIKKEYSEFGKEYSPADFDEELIESVEVINQINPGDDTSGYDLDYWQHMLSLNLKVPSEDNVEKAIKAAYDNPEVQVAHKNYRYTLEHEKETVDYGEINASSDVSSVVEIGTNAFGNNDTIASSSTQRIGVTPNDTEFDEQSAILFSKANRAWAFATGNSNVRVGVVDTGINNHEDLNINSTLSKNFTDKPGLNDVAGHGTRVAGIIGAKTNNSRGIAGVCWNVTIVNLKVYQLDEDGELESSIFWITNAINYASQNSIKLLNMSLECANLDSDEINMLTTAVNGFNGLIICAAGNDANNQTNIQYPSQISSGKLISVTSCDNSGELAADAKYSPVYVDIITQGVGVETTSYPTLYESRSGTSYAAPFVTGAAALLLGINPNYTWMQLRTAILGMVDVDDDYSGIVAMSGKLNILQSVLISLGYGGVGDVDMNGSITAADSRLALRISAQLETATLQEAVMVDVNYDDLITAADAQIILNMAAGTASIVSEELL